MAARPLELDQQSRVAGCSLHSDSRDWPLTNCYVDLWVELLWHWGYDPIDTFAYCVTQDFDADHFTFFKPPMSDLEMLHGVRLEELALYDDLERHLLLQTRRGRVLLVEVDGFFLPDTRTTSYQREHTKTTIGVIDIEPASDRCRYAHNSGVHLLAGDDYRSALRPARANGLPLLPYAEMAWRGPYPDRADRHALPLALLRRHLLRRPDGNPIAAFRAAFPALLERIFATGPESFHGIAFNTFRQLGACHAYLGDFLRWLDGYRGAELAEAAAACDAISVAAKSLQLRTARLAARRRLDPCDDAFDNMQAAHARLHRRLDSLQG